jgi:hypothetical protein
MDSQPNTTPAAFPQILSGLLANNNNSNNDTTPPAVSDETETVQEKPRKKRVRKPNVNTAQKEADQIKSKIETTKSDVNKGKQLLSKERNKAINLRRKFDSAFSFAEKVDGINAKLNALGDDAVAQPSANKVKKIAREILTAIEYMQHELARCDAQYGKMEKATEDALASIEALKAGLLKDSFHMAKKLTALYSNGGGGVGDDRLPRIYNYRNEQMTPEADKALFL